MKKSLLFISLIISVLAMSVVSCNKKKDEPTPTHTTVWYSPEPGENGTLPESILPDSLMAVVTEYITINTGENPPTFTEIGQFKSSPHILLAANWFDPKDSTDMIGARYSDRMVAFLSNNGHIDYYGKQWDPTMSNGNGGTGAYYEEAYRNLFVIGTGEEFTTYYLMEGYPNGMYAKQSTVFSGKWNESYGGLMNFQVAVILLETSGNPELAPAGTYRVLGDGDGLAQDTVWMGNKRASFEAKARSDEDAFSMFRVK